MLIGWLLVLLVFGIFAVHVENALAGAGWQASNSQSVAARAVIEKNFAGLGATGLQVVIVDHRGPIASDPAARAVVAKATSVLRSDPRVSTVVAPQAGVSISKDGRTAIVTAGSAADANKMVQAADSVQPKLAALSSSGVSVTLTGDSALWADFNTANRSAMLKSELLSWPVTIIILVIAFGSLVAAGLPLLLTMAGLLVAAGALVITTKFTPVSIWALNFALMFALALGIDYALFLVMRFRSALERRGAEPGDREAIVASVAETVDTAGKAVAFSALTVLASLAAILIVPSPAFRSMAFGIMLSVIAVLAATLTLLPAVLGKLGTNINKGTIRLGHGGPKVGEGPLDRQLHRWGKFLWKHPFPAGAAALVFLLVAAAPIVGMRTNMPSITIVPPSANARVGYYQVTNAFGPGAPGTLQVVVP
ncbi:MAG TPA: MMPL family transporter, partial [Acidimicrobiales bacterium]